MSFFNAIRIAFRNLWRRKLRTALTIIAVTIGVVAVVSLVSIALGARNALVKQLESVGMLSKITIVGSKEAEGGGLFGNSGGEPEDSPNTVKLTDDLVNRMSKVDHVINVSPDIRVWNYETMIARVGNEEIRMRPNIQAIGVTGKESDKDKLTLAAGRFFNSPDEKNTIIIGDGYRKKMKKEREDILGTQVTLVSRQGFFGVNDTLPSSEGDSEELWKNHQSEIKATIVGITPPGPTEFDSYVPVNWAKQMMLRKEYDWEETKQQQKIFEEQRKLDEQQSFQKKFDGDNQQSNDFQMPPMKPKEILRNDLSESGYQSLSVEVDDIKVSEQVAETIRNKFGVGAITPKTILDAIFKLFRVVELILGAIGSITLGVASIGIINTMVMAIYERTREIGLMKAVGASKGVIRKLFMIEASIIGFLGGAFGLGIGYGLSIIANKVANYFMVKEGIALTNLIQLPFYLVAGVIVFSTLIGALAGVYPAMRAARLDPIKALHYE